MALLITHRRLFSRVTGALAALATLAGIVVSALALSPPPGTFITNQATATYTASNRYIFPAVQSNIVSTEMAAGTVLQVSATTNSDPVAAGEVVTYTITVTNSGNLTAGAVTAVALLPGNLQFQSASNGGTFIPGGTVNWNLGALSAGVSVVLTVSARVSGGATIPFSVSAASPGMATAFANLVTAVGASPILTIVDTSTAATVNPGGTIEFTINYSNIGNRVANAGVINNELPSGTALIPGSITGGGLLVGRTITWPIGAILPGVGGAVSFKAAVSNIAFAGEIISNVSTILSNETAVVTSNRVSVTVTAPLLTITKTVVTDTARPGNRLSYVIVVKNMGGVLASGVQLRDPIPSGVSYLTADAGGSVQSDGVNWTVPSLEPGATATVHLDLAVDKTYSGLSVSNTAFVTANGSTEISSTVEKAVVSRTRGLIEFIDVIGDNSRKVYQYEIGNKICIQVTDADRNINPLSAETVSVTVDHITRLTGGAEAVDDSVTALLTENGKNSAIFQGCFDSNAGPPVAGDSLLSLGQDSAIRATYTDPLDADPVSTASAFIDPFGVVFDSTTGNPVSNAVVRMIDDATGLDAVLPQPPLVPATQENPVITSSNGRFQFQYVNPGSYHFVVVPKDKASDFSFPSVVADADLPATYLIHPGSRGKSFILSVGMQPLNLDIPVDPPPGQLQLVKTSNKDYATIGDMVSYTVTISNMGKSDVSSVKIMDTMPHGVHYLKGSSLIAGIRGADPEFQGNRVTVWSLQYLKTGESVSLTYTVVVGPDSQRGDGKNSVRASGKSLGIDVSSNTAVKAIKINGGVFTSEGLIIGKVTLMEESTQNGSGSDGLVDRGVAGASLYMEDGTRVVTDGDGKFSISGVRPGTHLLRLDETSLPKGTEPVSDGNRFMGANSSQFVDITSGGMFKANFGVQKKAKTVLAAKGAITAEMTAATVQSCPPASSPQSPEPSDTSPDPEKLILEMTPELGFLNLKYGEVAKSSRIKFMVKAASEAVLTVSVNDKVIGPENIGKKISSKNVTIYEFVNIPLEPGEQTRIRLETRDPFGNLRESKSLSVQTTDAASRIMIIPSKKEIPADGETTIKVRVLILDRNGLIVPYPENVTVSTSTGEIIESDADPGSPGVQVSCRQGIAVFTIKAPFETADARISVSYNNIDESVPLFFAPHLRSTMVVGVGEVTLGYGKTNGAYSLLKQDTHISNDLYLWGRGAFFVKGELWKGTLLTASFDSDKKKQEDFFRTASRNVEAEDKYPLYGDESKTGYEALSREKMYVRVDKGRSSLLYGDYETGLNGTRLSAYNRTLTGLKGELNLDDLKVTSFASYADQTQVVDNLPAQGISGYYFLNKPAVEGTERIVIETRDRQRIDRVLAREIMSRWSDYTIDYDMGTILFKSPVPSHDANLNPVYIIATYESRGGGTKYAVYGGRGVAKPLDALELGVTAVVEQKASFGYHLLGTDVTLKLPGNSTIKAEISQTDSSFDIDNALSRKNGNAWSVEVESKPLPLLLLSGYYRSISDYFDNPSATDSMRGTRKYGVDGKYGQPSSLQFKGRFFSEQDLLNNSDHTLASMGVEKTHLKSKFGLDIIRETSTDHYVPTTSSSRNPFDIPTEAAREMTALHVNAETPLFADLSGNVSLLQDIQHNRHNLSQLGLNYQLNKKQRFFVREEFARYEDRNENRTVLGGESLIGSNTVAFQEYRLASGIDGRRSQQSIGLRNKFMLAQNITGNINIEKLTTLSGGGSTAAPDTFAVATGLEYLPLSILKITGRLEYRQELSSRSQNSWLGELNAAWKLRQDYTLIFAERYFYNEFKNEGDRITTRTSVGVAYRPVTDDRFNALAKVELKHEENSIQPQNIVSDAYIFSLQGVFQATRSLQIIGKYAGKATVENGFSAYTDLYSGRVLYDLTKKIDVGAEYRLMTSHATHAALQGGSAEIGYKIVKNVWFSTGYSFDRFDVDLAGDSYTGEGPFIRLRVKFDENSLKDLNQR